ncbi:MAG: CapA family protein [Treponemataceae bacterium]|nr:CapA family protein [Treponemataceae bacterium]
MILKPTEIFLFEGDRGIDDTPVFVPQNRKKRYDPWARGVLFLFLGIGLFSACTKEQDVTLYCAPEDQELVQSLPPLPWPWRLKSITSTLEKRESSSFSQERGGPLSQSGAITPVKAIGPFRKRNTIEKGPVFEIRHVFQYEERLFKEQEGDVYKVLAYHVYAPRTFVLDERASLSLREVLHYMAKSPQGVVPLSDIRLPYKALKVDGLFPGEQGYPLIEKVVLLLRLPPAGASSETTYHLLHQWFSSLPSRVSPSFHIYTLAFVGDIMPGRGVDTLLLRDPKGLERVFGDVLPLLLGHDLCLGNLEGALTEQTVRVPKSYNFKFSPRLLPLLRQAGFAYLSLTNNHIYDYGEEGLLDTLKAFEQYQVGTSGIGRTLSAAVNPWWWPPSPKNPSESKDLFQKPSSDGPPASGFHSQDTPSRKNSSGTSPWLAVFSLGAYPREKNGFDGERLAAVGPNRPGILWAREEHLHAVRPFLQESPFSVVMVHGGTEWISVPSKEQRALYRHLVDEGADLVVGSHPHVIQGMEVYKGKLIAYSLGNFLFPGMGDMPGGEESLILSVGVYEGHIRYVECIPVVLSNTGVRLEKGERIRRFFYELSRALQ